MWICPVGEHFLQRYSILEAATLAVDHAIVCMLTLLSGQLGRKDDFDYLEFYAVVFSCLKAGGKAARGEGAKAVALYIPGRALGDGLSPPIPTDL